MNISIIKCTQVDHIDELERDIIRFAVTARIDDNDYELDVHVDRENDNYIEFDDPEVAGFDADGQDELFSAVSHEVDQVLG